MHPTMCRLLLNGPLLNILMKNDKDGKKYEHFGNCTIVISYNNVFIQDLHPFY